MIDWENRESHVLINPRLPEEEKAQFLSFAPLADAFKDHIWLMTSGSTSLPKWVGLSKEAFLISAQAVNEHLESNSRDVWIHSLPDFHVGGLGVWARSYLSQTKVIDFKKMSPRWDPYLYHQTAEETCATLGALVPAQVYDLVVNRLSAPKSLRAIIVGGGAFDAQLCQKAIQLGWNLLPSYGLTECASQVATASLTGDKSLKPLKHVAVSITNDGFIKIKSRSLLSTYAVWKGGWQLIDPKCDEYFITEDCGQITNNHLVCLGRKEGFVKIGGENTNFQALETRFEQLKLDCQIKQDVALILAKDERLGHVIHLLVAGEDTPQIQVLVEQFQNKVLPFEKIRKINFVNKINRSPLNKLIKK